MATDAEISAAANDALLNALQAPKREQSGTRIVEEHPIGDLLKARDSAIGTNVTTVAGFGLGIQKITPRYP